MRRKPGQAGIVSNKPKIPGWLRCPRRLGEQERAEWRRLAPVLFELLGPDLQEIDTLLLELCCMGLVVWDSVRKKAEADPWNPILAECVEEARENAIKALAGFAGSLWASDYLERRKDD